MHRRFLPRVLVGAAALLLSAAANELSAQEQGDQRENPEIKRLNLRGVSAVEKDELVLSIKTEASRCRSILVKPFCLFSNSRFFVEKHYLDRAELRRDMLRTRVFYWKRGYREAKVDTVIAVKGDDAVVDFRITEGPPTLVSSITVNRAESVLSDKTIARNMRLRAGKPLNLLALDSSAVLLRNVLGDAGYGDAVVKIDTIIVADSARAAAVRMSVDPKWKTVIGEINIRGLEKISERTIRNSLTLKVGRLYKRNDLITSQRNLYESNLFRRAVIIIPPLGDSIKTVQVTVQEAPLREVRTSAGFNTIEFGQVEGRFTNYNFFGAARRLNLRGTVGNLLASQLNNVLVFRDIRQDLEPGEVSRYLAPTWLASAEVQQPWFRDPRNTVGVAVFAHRRSSPGIFIDRGFGTSGSFTRQLAIRSLASASYRVELTRVEAGDVYFCQNFGICEPETISALRRQQQLSPVSISTSTDRSNDPLSPTRGYIARIDAEHASAFTLSDFRYNRVSAEVSKYGQFRPRGMIGARVRAGWVDALGSTSQAVLGRNTREGILHPRKRFYAGGAQSVRGYGENQLGPRVLTVDPAKLLDTTRTRPGGPPACTAATIADASCDPNFLKSEEFQPRPTGGSTLVEASVEYRFYLMKHLEGAVFVDGALVGQGSLETVVEGTGAITPGLGFRYHSPVGPIRVDLGIKPTLAEKLFVVTETADHRIVRLTTEKSYDPLEDSRSGIRQVLDRLTLHLSIGQAF